MRNDKVLLRFIRFVGPLRAPIIVMALLSALPAPFMHATIGRSGWLFVLGVAAPMFAITLLFMLPLDMAMTGLFMSDKQGAERARLKRILVLEAVVFVILLAAWFPLMGGYIAPRSPAW